jgi:hypothetical protein
MIRAKALDENNPGNIEKKRLKAKEEIKNKMPDIAWVKLQEVCIKKKR